MRDVNVTPKQTLVVVVVLLVCVGAGLFWKEQGRARAEREAAAQRRAAQAALAEARAGIPQKLCPVMPEEKIDPDRWVKHDGRKIYLCCDHCVDDFRADPERYRPNLRTASTDDTRPPSDRDP